MNKLNIAIPSKGRLKEKSEDWLLSSGFKLAQKGGGRGYTAELKGLPDANVMLLSAREIAEELIRGNLHIGVTGQDLVHDLSGDVERDVHVIKPLGFGGADVIVAVPAAWLDVDTMADLEAAGALFRARHGRRMRVATKYLRLTRRFFADKSVGEYRLIESAGATEAAPAAGSAEVIVDITSTGATLKANGLKILSDGVILKSQAALIGSKRAVWGDDVKSVLGILLDGIEAASNAKSLSRLEPSGAISQEMADQLGLRILAMGSVLCSTQNTPNVCRELVAQGLGPVAVTTVKHVYGYDSDVLKEIIANLSQTA